MNGFIKSLNLNKGQGSISIENGDQELMFYQAALSWIQIIELKLGDKVSFDIIETNNRELNAINITRYKSIKRKLPLT